MKASLLAMPAAMLAGATAITCPGSPAAIHASCKVTVTAAADCATVRDEMIARINGQYSKWHDPHHNGTYAILDQSASNMLKTKRTTGNHKPGPYTDLHDFTFTAADGNCQIEACSESQVTSVADYSTNYCNLRMLYCGSAEGCKPVTTDIKIDETSVKPSFGAGKDASACLATGKTDNIDNDTYVFIPTDDCKAPLKWCFQGTKKDIEYASKLDPVFLCRYGDHAEVKVGTCPALGFGERLKTPFGTILKDPVFRKVDIWFQNQTVIV